MKTRNPDALDELYRVPENGKAEIVRGELVTMSPTGADPGRAGGEIYFSLRLYEESSGGSAFPDNVGFVVSLPHRGSFSPDAAWHAKDIGGMDFVQEAPTFAVEIRSKKDYGPRAEKAIRAKIDEYFMAGTKIVWDVDLLDEAPVRKYASEDPDHPVFFRRGETADAEPAVPGWRFRVDRLYRLK